MKFDKVLGHTPILMPTEDFKIEPTVRTDGTDIKRKRPRKMASAISFKFWKYQFEIKIWEIIKRK